MIIYLLLPGANNIEYHSQLVDKHQQESFTWERCLEAISKWPPVGNSCFYVHDVPITLDRFAEIAFECKIFTDPMDYESLRVKLESSTVASTNPGESSPPTNGIAEETSI